MAKKASQDSEKNGAKVVPLRRSRRCPICDAESDRANFPFCSKRCADIDLNRWLKGSYAIAAVEQDDSDIGDGGEDGA